MSHVDGHVGHLIDDRLANVASAERNAYRLRLAAGHGYDEEQLNFLQRCSESSGDTATWTAATGSQKRFPKPHTTRFARPMTLGQLRLSCS